MFEIDQTGKKVKQRNSINFFSYTTGEFDPGSERTLAACLTHASRTRKYRFGGTSRVAHG